MYSLILSSQQTYGIAIFGIISILQIKKKNLDSEVKWLAHLKELETLEGTCSSHPLEFILEMSDAQFPWSESQEGLK